MFMMLEEVPEYRDRLLQALYGVMSDPRSETATHALRVLAEQQGDVTEVLP
jgi:hypothetical protein